jgi:hypothetical protein
VIAFQEVDGPEAAERVFDPARYQLHVAAQSDLSALALPCAWACR